MRLNPLSLMGGSYADNSLTWSAQRTLNWLPETAEVEGTRTPIKFADPPGLRSVVDLGTNAPIRGIQNVEGKLFVVSGTSLFEIASNYTATNRGNIPGVGRVSMAHNKQGGSTAANQLAIANGLSGYVYNTSTNVLAQITDESFEGATTVDYIDGYITFTDPQGRFWGHSALNQAGEYSTVDRYDAESAPDGIVSHIASHREAIVFGTRTTEFFRNTGAATNTFQRVDGTELEVGICSTFARARVDNSVCWVSDTLEVFRLEGHSPQRISTRPIEQLLHTVNPANIFAFSWEERGHKVFYITAPEAFTIGFDFASGMWHERQTFDLPRWRVNALTSWNGLWIAGDYTNGLLYELDWDTHHENGLELIRERASGYTHGGQNKVLAPYVELLFDTGVEEVPEPPLTITGDLSNGMVNQVVSYQYTATGSFLPLTLSIVSGSLPTGLSMSSSGLVTGTRTAEGSFSWVVMVTDAIGNTAALPDTSSTAGEVISLLHFDTGEGSTSIIDESGRTWEIFAPAGGAMDSSWVKFGPSSWQATSGDVVRNVAGQVPATGSGDFTFEGWFRNGSTSTAARWLLMSGDTDLYIFKEFDRIYLRRASTGTFINLNSLTPLDSVSHIVLQRASGVVTVKFNGADTGFTLADTNSYNRVSVELQNANCDEVRYVIGAAMFGNSFTPPTQPYTFP